MAFVSKEFIDSTPTLIFPSIIQAIKEAGWEEVYVISSSSVVLRTNGEDGTGPWIYLNIYLQSSSMYIRGYQYWEGSSGYCPFPNSGVALYTSSTTLFRIYATKNFVCSQIGTGYFFIVRPPIRFFHICNHSITGATSVQITLDSVSGIRIGYKYNIFGIKGEGQQEILVNAVDRVNKIITVSGCTNNYAAGALVGECILTCLIRTGGYNSDQFPFNRIGTANMTTTNIWFAGKNGAEGAPYAHDSNYNLESLIVKNSYRFLGDVSSKYIKYAKSITAGDVCYVINSDDPVVDSVPTSFTQYSLTDTTKNWTVDSLIGKSVLFISGTGVRHSRYIIGNTSNTLTFRLPLPVITVETGYRIVDAVYRSIDFETTAVIKEEF